MAYVVNLEEFLSLSARNMGRSGHDLIKDFKSLNGLIPGDVTDVVTAAAALDDFKGIMEVVQDAGLSARYYYKSIRGTDHLIIKPGKQDKVIGRGKLVGERQFLTRNHYPLKDQKLVRMGLGNVGLRNTVIRGTGLVVVAYGAVNLMQVLADDEKTWSWFLGTTMTDIAKTVVASGAGFLIGSGVAGAFAGTVAGFLVGPLVGAVLVSVGVGVLLNILDDYVGLTDAIIATIANAEAETRRNGVFGQDRYGMPVLLY